MLPYSDLQGKIPQGYPDPTEIAKRSKVQFDTELSSTRYYLVQSLFDQTITFRLKELQAATKAIMDAERKLGAAPSGPQADLLKQAKELAYRPVVDSAKAADASFLKTLAGNKKDATVNSAITQLESQWNTAARERYEQARSLAIQASK